MLVNHRSASGARIKVYYRFQVVDRRTGEPYVITLAEDGSPIESGGTAQPFDRCFDVDYNESDVPRLVPSLASR